jgi:hypothetical protein
MENVIKLCIKCKTRPIHKSTHSSYCRECSAARQREWRLKNQQKNREYANNYTTNIRKNVLKHYGNKCACCGEETYQFLSIDHVENNGAKHRKEIGYGRNIYFWLKKNNYPSGFQVLCFNCNLAKGHWGFCPHNNKHGQD